MARNASRFLILLAPLILVACGEDFVPAEPVAPTTAERLGVPKGADVFRSRGDAAEFDEHVDRFAEMQCTTLNATIAALNSRDGTPAGATGRIARVGGSVLPGPAGALARATLGELSAASAAEGDVRLSAAQAVRVAKDC